MSQSVQNDAALRLRFHDGWSQVIFLPSAFRGVFARLNQPAEFRQARLQDGVLTWPGELDLAPDAMHQAIAFMVSGCWIDGGQKRL